LRNTVVLSAACIVLSIPLFGWKCGLAVAAGSVLAYINFRWLHHASALMVERMISTGRYSKFPLVLAFLGRCALLIAVAYVIFESSSTAFYGFLVALLLPIAGAIGEAVYEAMQSKNTGEVPN